MNQTDTITALATPPGRGGIGILRTSGPSVKSVAQELLGNIPKPRQAEYLPFRDYDNSILDYGIALFFPSPHSFTGEDILELHGHGGPIILDLLLKRILTLPGVRIARPGEFSERAFLNNKVDLTQAEAIADLINASSTQAARSAINSLQGVFSISIRKLIEALVNLRMYVETTIDFSNEEMDFFTESKSKSKIEASLNDILAQLDHIRIKTRQGSILREGRKVVIAGNPNAGKSSLMNALAGREVAIVSSIVGTTRDILHEYIHLEGGIPLHIIDTAGLRNVNNHDEGEKIGEVEKIGIERAWCEIERADHLLFIVDSTETSLMNREKRVVPNFISRLPSSIQVTIVRNKADLTGEKIGIESINNYSFITLSAKSGRGIDILRTHLKKSIGLTSDTEGGNFLARRRHLNALETAATHLLQGKDYLINTYAYELFAEELRLAQQNISEITGEFRSNDLLSKIFSNFCIGK